MPTIVIIEHEEDVDARRLASDLHDLGATTTLIRPGAGDDVSAVLPARGPHAPAPDAIVVLGGRMSAYDDERAPWLPAVRALLTRCINEGVRTLGICLGHQLIARAAGGSVACSLPQFHEFGVVPLTWCSHLVPLHGPAQASRDAQIIDEADPLRSLVADLARIPVAFADHNDAVDELPAHVRVLARSERCIHAIAAGGCVLGVQFHPEVDRAWVEHSLASSGLDDTQAEQILSDFDLNEQHLAAGCQRLARWLVSGI